MEKILLVKNESGVHARPAGLMVKIANKFSSHVEIQYKDKKANAKSLLSVMGLGLIKGSEVTIIANGGDEAEVIEEFTKLFESNFGEN